MNCKNCMYTCDPFKNNNPCLFLNDNKHQFHTSMEASVEVSVKKSDDISDNIFNTYKFVAVLRDHMINYLKSCKGSGFNCDNAKYNFSELLTFILKDKNNLI